MSNDKLSDEWRTPDWLFEQISKEHGPFDIDLCATKENSKRDDYCIDYLKDKAYCISEQHEYSFILACTDWLQTAFLNPPYSNPKPFIEKAWEDSKHCKIVALVKCDSSTQWWATFWNYDWVQCYYCNQAECAGMQSLRECTCEEPGPKPGCLQPIYFPKRIKFDPPQQLVDSGEVWRLICSGCDNKNIGVPKDVSYCRKCDNKGDKWVQKCDSCDCTGFEYVRDGSKYCENKQKGLACTVCKGKGYIELSSPNFASCLLIFDRRNI